jgi:NADH-quinone oxidoreductase subunit M
MMPLDVPWLEVAVLLPLAGCFWVRRLRDPDMARRHSLVIAGLALACTLAAHVQFDMSTKNVSHVRWNVLAWIGGETPFAIDTLNAPLLPLACLLYLLTFLGTLRTKWRRFSFPGALASFAILLATLSCRQPWIIIGLLAAGIIPPFIELAVQRKSTRVYVVHMGFFVVLLVAGQVLVAVSHGSTDLTVVASVLIMMAILVRAGIAPAHCWMSMLFEQCSFGTALLFVTPMVGAYAAVRLVLPIASESVLHGTAVLSLVTALYAAGMALVQREARRFFCFLFLSHSSLVFVGLATATPIGLTGALCVWLSVGLSLTGFGLTLRSIEARAGRLSLDVYHGLHGHIPTLSSLFLLTGLASIGFPGTIGFVGAELLVEGAVQVSPLVGIAIVVAAALNGLAVLHAYFRLFAGTPHVASINLQVRLPERIAVLALSALLLGGGLYPQPGVTSRHNAALELMDQRNKLIYAAGSVRDAVSRNGTEPSKNLESIDLGRRAPKMQ